MLWSRRLGTINTHYAAALGESWVQVSPVGSSDCTLVTKEGIIWFYLASSLEL